jgi:hypothetical protein
MQRRQSPDQYHQSQHSSARPKETILKGVPRHGRTG